MLVISGAKPSKQGKNLRKALSALTLALLVMCRRKCHTMEIKWDMAHSSSTHGYVFHCFFENQETEYVSLPNFFFSPEHSHVWEYL